MKNIYIYFIAIISLIMMSGMVSASGIDNLYVGGTNQGRTGDNVDVFVNATNAVNIGSATLDLLFNGNVIRADTVVAGDLATGSIFTSNINNNTGKVSIALISIAGFSGSGPLAKITFRVVGNTGDRSLLNISLIDSTDPSNNPAPAARITNSTFTVVPPSCTLSITAPTGVTAEATGQYSHPNIGTATSNNCGPPVVITNNSPVAGFPVGRTVVTWTATNVTGGIATGIQNVTIRDTTPPTIVAPPDRSVVATGTSTHVDLGIPTVSDIADPSPIVTNNSPPGNNFPVGRTVVTWNATDHSGNLASAVQNVTVRAVTTNILFSIDDYRVRSGQNITVPLRMNTSATIGSVQLNLTFNNTLVTIDSITQGSSATGLFSYQINNAGGHATVGIISDAGMTVNGSVADIKYNATTLGCGSGCAINTGLNVTVEDITDPLNNPLSATNRNGILTIYTRLKGDANDDGRITTADALLYLRFAVGQNISPYHLDPVADDVTCDGRITTADALKVLRKAVGQNVNLDGC